MDYQISPEAWYSHQGGSHEPDNIRMRDLAWRLNRHAEVDWGRSRHPVPQIYNPERGSTGARSTIQVPVTL